LTGAVPTCDLPLTDGMSPPAVLPARRLPPTEAQSTQAAAALREAELVARIRAGDGAAYETLYVALHEPLWRFAYGYVQSSALAEEIVQEVFLALWRDRARWDVTTTARAWLFGAVRNHALNHLRHERTVARLADRFPTSAVDAAPDAHTTVVERELDEAADRALAALPERRRVAMTLHWKHGLAPAEIAPVLGTTPQAVRALLTRARHELAALLDLVRR
jgi:RNA polymerase sigma-70 factor (ECF subfamily)